MNSKIKQIVLLTAVCLSFVVWNTGCTGNRPLYGGANMPALLKNPKRMPVFNYTDSKADNYYLKIYDNAASADQQAVRNRILNDLMTMIDYNYHQFENNLRGDKAVQELGADIATLGLTAASTVMGGAETKTILSAIATGVVGVNSSIDKEVFQNNTIQALQLQMRAARADTETKLNTGMKQSITNYPLEYGVRDVVAYYYAGSLNDALIGLVQNSSTDAKTSQAAAATAR
jgi:hypothetical protein